MQDFIEKIRSYGRENIECSIHTFFRLSEKQRTIFTCENIKQILLNDIPVLAGIQHSGCYAAFYKHKNKRFMKIILDIKACEGHPYIFVSPERLDRIKERRKIGKWNSRSELINNITRRFAEIRCRANVANCTIHDLRRSAITNWAQYLPIQVVQELAGHADIKTTREFYLTVRPEDFVLASKVLQKVTEKTRDN